MCEYTVEVCITVQIPRLIWACCAAVADYEKRRYCSLPEKGYNPRLSAEFYRHRPNIM
jgi:hypothetical protein